MTRDYQFHSLPQSSKVWPPSVDPTSGSDGGFTLDYPDRHPGQRVQLVVNKEGYVVVNELQLDLALPADPDARPLQIILCKEADREEMARRFYRLKSFEVIEETYQRQVKGLDAMQPATAITMGKLQQERDQAKANAEKASEGLAKEGLGQRSPLCRQVRGCFWMDESTTLLSF